MVFEFFAESGLISFGDTPASIAPSLARGAALTSRSPADSEVDTVTDLMLLSAAELTLVFPSPVFAPLETGEPVVVRPEAASLAPFLTNSGPFWGHDPKVDPSLLDVTLFASDASKLAWLTGSTDLNAVADRLPQTAARLATLHRGVDSPIYGETTRFALVAMLWRGKIAVLRGESEYQPRIVEVRDAVLHPGQHWRD